MAGNIIVWDQRQEFLDATDPIVRPGGPTSYGKISYGRLLSEERY